MSDLASPVTKTDHMQGESSAQVTLLEYGDYECSYCAVAFPIVQQVQAHFGHRLKFVFRHFPLKDIHPLAEDAAEVAEFAAAHGKFWEMHSALYQNQNELGPSLYSAIAVSERLPEAGLRAAIAHQQYAKTIDSDYAGGIRSGVTGTPAFFINGARHDSSYEYDELCAAIEAQLATPD